MVEAGRDANIEKILFIDTEASHDIPFGDVIEGWFGCQKINGNYEFVDARVEEGIGWAVNCTDVRL